MTEQPAEPVLKAEVRLIIFDTQTISEIDNNPGDMDFKQIAKAIYAVARDYERMHREQLRKEKQDRKKDKPEDGG